MQPYVDWNQVAHNVVVQPRGSSLGQVLSPWEMSSPSMALYRHALGQPMARAMGQNGLGVGLGAGMVAAVILVAVAVNYQLGKAMAPNPQVEGKWAWGNAIGGTLFPPFTLAMAIYKNYFRD